MTATKILPTMFFIRFIITGTVVLVYILIMHTKLPCKFTIDYHLQECQHQLWIQTPMHQQHPPNSKRYLNLYNLIVYHGLYPYKARSYNQPPRTRRRIREKEAHVEKVWKDGREKIGPHPSPSPRPHLGSELEEEEEELLRLWKECRALALEQEEMEMGMEMEEKGMGMGMDDDKAMSGDLTCYGKKLGGGIYSCATSSAYTAAD
ncbi:hypothetical protein B7494_g2235 [Chlorociboria aeruginascens]|nr:hypothetical protein B7494_g2235 [Chlorociboria aeruginascens]